MKSCPRCSRQYPDSELFCATDGTALIRSPDGGHRLTTPMAAEQSAAPAAGVIECPVCGGKAQPGEVICNFCGAQLPSEPEASPPNSGSLGVTARRSGPREFGDEPLYAGEPPRQRAGRSLLTIAGFALAALIALAAGAWLALYLGNRRTSAPLVQASPAPVAAAPTVTLARGIPVQVVGDGAGIAPRDINSMGSVFENNKSTLGSVYHNALGTDRSMRDGMLVRLHILPDGEVDNGAVRVSTSANPSFDAEVIEAMTSWKFASAGGTGVTADYPLIFAPAAADAPAVESDLANHIASLSPAESPEYAFSPSAPSSAPTVAAVAPAVTAKPTPAAAPSSVARVPTAPRAVASAPAASHASTRTAARRRHRHPRRELAALPPAKPPLIERVSQELSTDRRLRRVHAYTNGSVVTIFGKVFDQNQRLLAERTVRHVDGVTAVINNVTTDTQEWAHNQSLIMQALQNAGLSGVEARVIGHDAYLSGQVKAALDRQRAVTVAQGAAPVTVRENLITVAIGNMLGF